MHMHMASCKLIRRVTWENIPLMHRLGSGLGRSWNSSSVWNALRSTTLFCSHKSELLGWDLGAW